jgi:hypothetical protein
LILGSPASFCKPDRSRPNTLDYHFGDHNWQKVTRMGEYCSHHTSDALLMCLTNGASLRCKILSAATDMAEHTIGHNKLSSTLSEEILVSWTNQVEAWENSLTLSKL